MAASSLDLADRGPRDAMLGRLVGFGRYVRASGLTVGTGRILSFCRAAAALDAFDREDLRLAARSTLVSRPEDLAALDAAFDRYFDMSVRGPSLGRTPEKANATPPRHGPDRQRSDTPRSIGAASTWSPRQVDDVTDEGAAIRVRASEAETLRRKDFGDLTEDERRAAFALIRRMALSMPERPSRRYRSGPKGSRFDLRGTIRRSLRTEGEPFRRAWKQRQSKRRPLVLLVDVSGSMAPYSRPLVEFAHSASLAGRRVEVFAFGTRLTRITRALRSRDPGEALAAQPTVVLLVHGFVGVEFLVAEIVYEIPEVLKILRRRREVSGTVALVFQKVGEALGGDATRSGLGRQTVGHLDRVRKDPAVDRDVRLRSIGYASVSPLGKEAALRQLVHEGRRIEVLVVR